MNITLLTYKNDLNKTWKAINDLISSKSQNCNKNISININGSLTSENCSLKYLMPFFSHIPSTVRDKIPYSTKHFNDYLKNPNLN